MKEKKKRRRFRGKPVVSYEEVSRLFGELKRICHGEPKRGPGTPEYSLMCSLSAINGNYPKVKRKTWEEVKVRCEALLSAAPVTAP